MAQIELHMMANIVNIIDVCTKRGAFEGSELASIASVRQWLVQNIEAEQPAQDPIGESTQSEE